MLPPAGRCQYDRLRCAGGLYSLYCESYLLYCSCRSHCTHRTRMETVFRNETSGNFRNAFSFLIITLDDIERKSKQHKRWEFSQQIFYRILVAVNAFPPNPSALWIAVCLSCSWRSLCLISCLFRLSISELDLHWKTCATRLWTACSLL